MIEQTHRRIALSRLGWRDALAEAILALVERPARSALTAAGTVLGVGTFVAVLGLTATAASQIGERFTVLTATEVTVTDARQTDGVDPSNVFPLDADRRIDELNGVVAGGVSWKPRNAQSGVAATSGGEGQDIPVIAASPGLLVADQLTVTQGRTFDEFHDSTRQRVALVGRAAAARLGIGTLENQPAVFVNGIPFTVIGIVGDSERQPDLLLSVVVPRQTAELLWGQPAVGDQTTMLITTRVGAATQVAHEAPLALRPDDPQALASVPPPDPHALRGSVDGDLSTLFAIMAAICLAIGAVGIANTTLVAVMERVPEIGLRRSLGARGRHIAAHVLAESAMLGAIGGVVGTSLGIVVVVLTSLTQGWSPTIEPYTVLAAPVVGLVVGLLAGVYPALKASRIEPVEALRR